VTDQDIGVLLKLKDSLPKVYSLRNGEYRRDSIQSTGACST